MALTINVTDRTVMGNNRVVTGTIKFDTTYPATGEDFTASNLGLDHINYMEINGPKYNFNWNNSTNKVIIYGVEQDANANSTDPFDAGDAGDMSTVIANFRATGY